jgi:peptide/nickel transport system permease protein
MIGFGAVVLQAFLGILFGLLAGYLGGKVDAVLMRIADVQLSFSTLMVAIIVGAVIPGPGHAGNPAVPRVADQIRL